MEYIKRHLEKEVLKASKDYPVVLVCGQRQVGKTTMLYNIKQKSANYITFDDAKDRKLAMTDPELLIEKYKTPLIIDEFQRAPKVLLAIKKKVDDNTLNNKKSNGLYWLTGSQKFKMMKNISESLAGRIAVIDMSSLTSREICDKDPLVFGSNLNQLKKQYNKDKNYIDINAIFKKIYLGGMPKIIASKVDRNNYYMDYINTYLERDIRELSQVGNIDTFNDFLIYMAARTSQELKYDDISKHLGISAPTAKAWVSILETTGVIHILKPYSNNITKRLIKTPKVYFMDTGLCAYLCGYESSKSLQNGPMNGAIFETYIVTEIIKGYLNSRTRMNLYYYRDIDKKEIDLLVVKDNTITPIEIKLNKYPTDANKNFNALKKFKMKINKGIIICLADDFIPYDKNTDICPASALL